MLSYNRRFTFCTFFILFFFLNLAPDTILMVHTTSMYIQLVFYYDTFRK